MTGLSPQLAAKSIGVKFFSLLDVGDGKSKMKEDWVHKSRFDERVWDIKSQLECS